MDWLKWTNFGVTTNYFAWFLIFGMLFYLIFGILPELFISIFGSRKRKFEHNFNFLNKGAMELDPHADRRYLLSHIYKTNWDYSYYKQFFERAGIPLVYNGKGVLKYQIGWTPELYDKLVKVGKHFKLDKKFKK